MLLPKIQAPAGVTAGVIDHQQKQTKNGNNSNHNNTSSIINSLWLDSILNIQILKAMAILNKPKKEMDSMTFIGFILRLILIFLVFAAAFVAIEKFVTAANEYEERAATK